MADGLGTVPEDMATKKPKATSAKQIAANQRNATRSTGPKTAGGKDAVKGNALKHGLLAKEVLLPGEEADSFQDLSDFLYSDLRPEGALETALVERIVGGYWRLRRLHRVEAGIFENEICAAARDRDDQGKSDAEAIKDSLSLHATPSRAAPSADEREQAIESAGSAEWAAGFMRDADGGNALSKLSRYETTIERSVFSSLHELQRLQLARSGGAETAPLAADVNVSISPS